MFLGRYAAITRELTDRTVAIADWRLTALHSPDRGPIEERPAREGIGNAVAADWARQQPRRPHHPPTAR